MNALYVLILGCIEHSVHSPITPTMITNDHDQQRLAYVPAGDYHIGSDHGSPDEAPKHIVPLQAFYLGIYEVSNQQFATFLNEMMVKQDTVHSWIGLQNIIDKASLISFTGTRYRTQYGYEDHPVIGVSYVGAYQYCQWAQLRLPTEEEWEAAAQGGRKSALYPWGDDSPEGRANYNQRWLHADKAPPTQQVGSYPANPYGLHDMAGNALEWTKSPYYPYNDSNLPVEVRLSLKERKVLRGGGFDGSDQELRITYRRNYEISVRSYYTGGIGFRCAKDAEPS